jgi:hypothetical protein
MTQPKDNRLDEILIAQNRYIDSVWRGEADTNDPPKTAERIIDLFIEIVDSTPILGPPHPQTSIYKRELKAYINLLRVKV